MREADRRVQAKSDAAQRKLRTWRPSYSRAARTSSGGMFAQHSLASSVSSLGRSPGGSDNLLAF